MEKRILVRTVALSFQRALTPSWRVNKGYILITCERAQKGGLGREGRKFFSIYGNFEIKRFGDRGCQYIGTARTYTIDEGRMSIEQMSYDKNVMIQKGVDNGYIMWYSVRVGQGGYYAGRVSR